VNDSTEAHADSDTTIRICGLHKSYKIYEKRFDFLKEALTGRRHHVDRDVLRGIDLTIRRGEVVGVIGRNGAGKSTLLKILAGTLAPSAGSIEVNGRVSAILELGTGFNPSYSGRDNVLMSGLMRGLAEETIRLRFDSIVAFAGLADVIDEPFHTYSSGMQARLAFAAAVAVDADILIIDEALAAGDVRFAARSIQRIHEICSSGVTALFVSHVSYHIMQLCTRAIWLDDGVVRMDGAPVDVVRAYEYEMHEAIARDQGRIASSEPVSVNATPPPTLEVNGNRGAMRSVTPTTELTESNRSELVGIPSNDLADAEPRFFSTQQYRIAALDFLDAYDHSTTTIRSGEIFKIRVKYECLLPELPAHSCGLAVAFNRLNDFEAVMYLNTNYPHSDEELRDYSHAAFRLCRARVGTIEATLKPIQLKAGQYYVSLGILPNQPGPHEFYEYRHCQYVITVLPNGFDEPAVFYPIVEWRNEASQ
jgi:ABC-type polysaccharide/polyol phosphate transport system ATPase subunit